MTRPRRWLGPWWLWTMLISALLTVAVWYSIPRAHADPMEPQVARYAAIAGPQVCTVLDQNPTLVGVAGTLEGVAEDAGFTLRQSWQVITYAAATLCPQHIRLLQRFLDTYAVPAPSKGVST
jgi:hypothetical protein